MTETPRTWRFAKTEFGEWTIEQYAGNGEWAFFCHLDGAKPPAPGVPEGWQLETLNQNGVLVPGIVRQETGAFWPLPDALYDALSTTPEEADG